MTPDARRRAALGRGHRAEWRALLALLIKGYWPLARRYGGKGGEIDLIVRRGRTLAFVEVKARRVADDAIAAVGAEKRKLTGRTSRTFISRHPQFAGLDRRFDLVVVTPGRWPTHIPDAYRPLE